MFTECGGFEVARTEERMEELRRRMSRAKAGVSRPSCSSPEFVKEKVPFLETTSSSAPSGRPRSASSTRCGPAPSCASNALATGALTVVPNVEVTGLDVDDGRIRGVQTCGGTIEADTS